MAGSCANKTRPVSVLSDSDLGVRDLYRDLRPYVQSKYQDNSRAHSRLVQCVPGCFSSGAIVRTPGNLEVETVGIGRFIFTGVRGSHPGAVRLHHGSYFSPADHRAFVWFPGSLGHLVSRRQGTMADFLKKKPATTGFGWENPPLVNSKVGRSDHFLVPKVGFGPTTKGLVVLLCTWG